MDENVLSTIGSKFTSPLGPCCALKPTCANVFVTFLFHVCWKETKQVVEQFGIGKQGCWNAEKFNLKRNSDEVLCLLWQHTARAPVHTQQNAHTHTHLY